MSPRSPTLWSRFRQTVGRALRETGQALDRVGIRGQEHALRPRRIGDNPCLFDDHLSRHRHQFPLLLRGEPKISPKVAYLAPCSTLIGTVVIGPHSSVWYGAVLRGDSGENGRNFGQPAPEPWELESKEVLDNEGRPMGGGIFIGSHTNVQDGCVITARQGHSTIGDGVTIGHLAQIHSATVQDHSLIGMGSILLEHSKVESEAMVAAGAVVPQGVTVKSGELWVGNPARKLRDLTREEREKLHYQANEYVKVAEGQKGVMELGGNMPDFLVEHVMLEQVEREEAKQAQEEPLAEKEPSLHEDKVEEDLDGEEERVSRNVG